MMHSTSKWSFCTFVFHI